MNHFIEICKNCGIIINQCRCPSLNKEKRYGLCEPCRVAINLKTPPAPPEPPPKRIIKEDVQLWKKPNKKTDKKSNKIINQITEIRAKNNRHWMALLTLAFAHAPEEAKQILKNISDCDSEINVLTKELAE